VCRPAFSSGSLRRISKARIGEAVSGLQGGASPENRRRPAACRKNPVSPPAGWGSVLAAVPLRSPPKRSTTSAYAPDCDTRRRSAKRPGCSVVGPRRHHRSRIASSANFRTFSAPATRFSRKTPPSTAPTHARRQTRPGSSDFCSISEHKPLALNDPIREKKIPVRRNLRARIGAS